MKDIELSVVIPIYNEEENILPLYESLTVSLTKIGNSYEIVLVDDGSQDKSKEVITQLCEKDDNLRLIVLRKNFGQTAAFKAGFQNANGRFVITMDADLQNDPSDIHLLITKLNEGYDCVSGWRFNRKDSITKRFFSSFANLFRRFITTSTIHDSGCSLKIYKRECLEDLPLFGEMHRYIPSLLSWKGFRIGEVIVSHHPRKFGKTKYGSGRIIRGFLDMLLVKFWIDYSVRPIHFFGGIGIAMLFSGFLINTSLVYDKYFMDESIGDRPLLLLGILFLVLGFQLIFFGLLVDILTKIYYKDVDVYSIEEIIEKK